MNEQSREAEQQPDESPAEQLDRYTIELLNELRIAGTGIQMMFAFADRAVQQRMASRRRIRAHRLCRNAAAGRRRGVSADGPSGPSSNPVRHGEKRFLIRIANPLAVAGMSLLALGFIGILVLLSDVVLGGAAPLIIGLLAAAMVGGLWFVLPIVRRDEE